MSRAATSLMKSPRASCESPRNTYHYGTAATLAGTRCAGQPLQWRDRLASAKALVNVGTEDACREALDIVRAFVANLKCETPHIASVYEGGGFGTTEVQTCSQIVCLLLRVSSLQLSSRMSTRRTRLLVQSLEACESCSDESMFPHHLILSGALGILTSIMKSTRKVAESSSILLPSLRIMCNVLSVLVREKLTDLPGLVIVLGELLKPSSCSPLPVVQMTLKALSLLSSWDAACHLIASSDVISDIVARSIISYSDPTATSDVLRMLHNLSSDDQVAELIVDHGAVPALLGLFRLDHPKIEYDAGIQDAESSSLTKLACAILGNLVGCMAGRCAIAHANDGIKRIVEHAQTARCGEERSAVGWVLVSLAVEQSLSGTVLAQGGIYGLMSHSSLPDERCREEAAWALATLSATQANAAALAECGTPRFIIGALSEDCGNPKATLQIAWTAANLTVDDGMKITFSEEECIMTILSRARWWMENSPSAIDKLEDATAASIVDQLMRALANIVSLPQSWPFIIKHDGLQTVIAALNYGGSTTNARRALGNLSEAHEFSSQILAKIGPSGLEQMLAREASEISLGVTLRMIYKISIKHGADFMKHELLETLLKIVETATKDGTQELALRVLYNTFEQSGVQSKIELFTSGSMLGRMGKVDVHSSTHSVQKLWFAITDLIKATLTPGSRRALVSASVLPKQGREITHDVKCDVEILSRKQKCNARRSSPLTRGRTSN